MAEYRMPTNKDLLQPVLTALHDLGGIAGTFMIDEAVIDSLRLPREVIEHIRPSSHDSRSEIRYRLAWARTNLKRYGLIENPQQGLWQLTIKGERTKRVNVDEVTNRLSEGDKHRVEEYPAR